MKKWLIAAATAVSLSVSSFAMAVDNKNPYLLIKQVADTTFSRLKADPERYQKDPNLLRGVAEQDVMPYINVRYAALKVLGPFARKATKEERDNFTQAFYDYLVLSYAQIFTQYTDQKVEIEAPKPIDANRKVVSVRVDIVDTSRPPIRLDFSLRKNGKTGEWQGFDVQVEGVSMLDTKASEWQGELRQHGINYVADKLEELAKAPIKKEADK